MGDYLYPVSWQGLTQVPAARFELIGFVENVTRWNEDPSPIREAGAEDLLGFLYDAYRVDADPRNLVGQLVFEDEAPEAVEFIRMFDTFLASCQGASGNLDNIEAAVLPEGVESAAKKLLLKLHERGLPEWVD